MTTGEEELGFLDRLLDPIIPSFGQNPVIPFALLHRFTDRSVFTLRHEPWHQFIERYSLPEIIEKKTSAKAIIFGSFQLYTKKVVSESLSAVPVLVCDSDQGVSIEELNYRFDGYERFVYSTHSHLLNEIPRYRVIMPFHRPLAVQEFKSLKQRLVSFLGERIDTASLNLTQPFFSHSFPIDRAEHAYTEFQQGKLLNPFDLPEKTIRHRKKFDVSVSRSKINKDIQWSLIKKAVDIYQSITPGGADTKGRKRSNAIHLLACKLYSYGLSETEVGVHLDSADHDNTKKRVIQNSLKTAQGKFPLSQLIFKKRSGTSHRIPRTYHAEPRKIILDESQFLSERRHELGIDQHYLTLIDGSTGIGKTTLFKQEESRAVMLMPMTCMVFQESKKASEDHIQGVWGDGRFSRTSNLFFATYDKISHLMGSKWARDLTLYIDEAHNWYTAFDYRSDVLRQIYFAVVQRYFKRVVLLSGTFKPDYFPLLEIDNHIVVRKQSDTKKQRCHLITTNNIMGSIEQHLKKGELQVVLLNDKSRADQWRVALERQGLKVQLLNADLKTEKSVVNLLEYESVDSSIDVLITTTFGVEGISLNNPNITKFHIYGRSFNSATLHQLASRARSPESPVEIFQWRSPNKTNYKISSLEFDEAYRRSKTGAILASNQLDHHCPDKTSSFHKHYGYYLCKGQEVGSLKDRSLICYHNGQIVPDQLGFAAMFYRLDTQKELLNDRYFREAIREYGWTTVIRRREVDIDSAPIVTREEATRERTLKIRSGVRELNKILKEYESESSEKIDEKLSEKGFKHKRIFSDYIKLSYVLEHDSDIIDCLLNSKIKKVMEFDELRKTRTYYLLTKIAELDREYSTDDRHIILAWLDQQMSNTFGTHLGVKWNKKTKKIDGKSSSQFFKRYFTCTHRTRYVNRDGRSSTERALTVQLYCPFTYTFKETFDIPDWSGETARIMKELMDTDPLHQAFNNFSVSD